MPTLLWARESEVATDILERRENRTFLPGVELPDSQLDTLATPNEIFADLGIRTERLPRP